VLAEELGRITCGGVSLAIGVQTDMATPALARFGSDELRASSSPPRSPATSSAASASARSAAGSDVASIKTTARKDGDDYIINGGKMWITNGIQADWMCCLANTDDGPAHKNKSLIIVPMNTKGVERARKLHKLGMWASDTAQIFFDDVRVPQRYRIGAEGAGFMLQMLQFQEERCGAPPTPDRHGHAAIDATIEYTRDRKAFGKSDPRQPGRPLPHGRAAPPSSSALRALIYRAAELFLPART
jgi:citronellyl-CoA dehydrogenase